MIDREGALQVARADAEVVYGDLDAFTEAAVLDGAVWRVDYELADLRLRGGGPHYEISAESGEIVSRRYEQ